MTYACTTREIPADTHLMELQNPQNMVLHKAGHLQVFIILKAYDFIQKIMRMKILITLDKVKPSTDLKHGCGQAHDISNDLGCIIANAE